MKFKLHKFSDITLSSAIPFADNTSLSFESPSTNGPFANGEEITGGTSGVTAKIHEVTSTTVLKFKEHKNSDGLREANTSATFTAGETVTGGTSGATGAVHGTQATAVVFGNIDTKALSAYDTIIGIRDVLPIKA